MPEQRVIFDINDFDDALCDEDALCDFAVEYADQTGRDYKAFVKAIRDGRIAAIVES